MIGQITYSDKGYLIMLIILLSWLPMYLTEVARNKDPFPETHDVIQK